MCPGGNGDRIKLKLETYEPGSKRQTSGFLTQEEDGGGIQRDMHILVIAEKAQEKEVSFPQLPDEQG